MRPTRSRVDVARETANRPPRSGKKTAIVWVIIGCIGIALTIAGLFQLPLLVLGAVFVLVSFPMAIVNFRKIGS